MSSDRIFRPWRICRANPSSKAVILRDRVNVPRLDWMIVRMGPLDLLLLSGSHHLAPSSASSESDPGLRELDAVKDLAALRPVRRRGRVRQNH